MSDGICPPVGGDIVGRFPPVPNPLTQDSLIYWDGVQKKYIDIGIGTGLAVSSGNLNATGAVGSFLPLSAGNGYPLSGDLYLDTGITIAATSGESVNNYLQLDNGTLGLALVGNNGSQFNIDSSGNIALVNNGATVTTTNTILDDGFGGISCQYLSVNSDIKSNQDGNTFIQYQSIDNVVCLVNIGDVGNLFGEGFITINGNDIVDSFGTFNLGGGQISLGSGAGETTGNISLYDSFGNLNTSIDGNGTATFADFVYINGNFGYVGIYCTLEVDIGNGSYTDPSPGNAYDLKCGGPAGGMTTGGQINANLGYYINNVPIFSALTTNGTTTLVSGTKAITISGLTSSNKCTSIVLVTPGGTLGAAYKGVCTTNTLTITAVSVAGATVVTDTSTLNYLVT